MSLPHNYLMTIGLEVHAQVTTATKLFSGSPTTFGAEPNSQANMIDMAMPGMLPVLNSGAVTAGIKLGLAIGATVSPVSVFARKNYYYPDLPKGYQISQYDQPIVLGGSLPITLPDGTEKTIAITRMHLEEDAGKSIHDLTAEPVSYVDLNRAGVPLMEIVSEPDITSPDEAAAYMTAIRGLLRFLGVCDGDMEKGNLRCDANVSVRKAGTTQLGTRCEIKNLNSIRHIKNAIQYEAERQVEILEAGGKIDQQTRLWDADKSETRTLRTKEDAHDYRYFPCPDLLPLVITPQQIEAVRSTMPKLPQQLKAEFMQHGLSAYDATVLTSEPTYVAYYQEMLDAKADPKLAANWLTVELFGALNKLDKELEHSPITAPQLAQLVSLISAGTLSGKMAKQVFATMLESGGNPADIVAAQGLTQISDAGALRTICQQVVASMPDAVAKFKGGNQRIFGSFVGAVMKETKGQANPELVNTILLEVIG